MSLTAGWREELDAASRSVPLADRFVTLLPPRPRLLDPTPGNGALFRWLAPRLARPQMWIFSDLDAAKLDHAFEACGVWAAELGFAVTFPGHARNRCVLVHGTGGAWRIEARIGALEPQHEADAIVCTGPGVRLRASLARDLGRPLLATLIADGQETMQPVCPRDPSRRPPEQRAPQRLAQALAARGFAVATAVSDWRVSSRALDVHRMLIDAHGRAPPAWHRVRRRQSLAGALAIRVGHRDILANPRGGT